MNENNLEEMQEDELFDAELRAMGIPYEDETAQKEMPALEGYEAGCEMPPEATERACREGVRSLRSPDAMYAHCEAWKKPEESLQKRLIGCTKWTLICGGIAMLLWWFWVNDLMAMQAAYPCICVCGVLGGFGVGKHAMR